MTNAMKVRTLKNLSRVLDERRWPSLAVVACSAQPTLGLERTPFVDGLVEECL